MAQLGIRLEQIGCLDVDQKIKNSIAHWKWFAGSHIEANPAIDGTLDRTASAKAIIAKLQLIEYFLAEAERNAASGNLYVAALYQALSFARDLYEFAIIDNESPIVARQESIKVRAVAAAFGPKV